MPRARTINPPGKQATVHLTQKLTRPGSDHFLVVLADEVAGRVMVPRRFRTFTSMTFPVDRRVAWVDLRTIKPAADVVAALIDAGRTRPHDIVAIHDADGWTHTRTTKMIQRLRAAGNR